MNAKSDRSTSDAILKVVFLIEEVIARLINEKSKITSIGKYESDITIQNFLQLTIRNVEALLLLCKHDFLLLPAALNIARPILEIGGNILWLMNPQDPYKRELRLVSLLKEEEKEIDKYLNNIKTLNVDLSKQQAIEEDREKLKEYYKTIQNRIPPDSGQIENKPNFRQLLEDPSLNLGNLYPAYRILCKSTHGSHAVTWLYKRETEHGFGELIAPKDWYMPLFICWWVLAQTGAKFLEIFGGDRELYLPLDLREEIKLSLRQLDICNVS
jgi:Family of unknown function (DUF5677)